MSELRRAVPAVITDLAQGMDYYWDAFHMSELHVIRTIAGRMLDAETDQELTPIIYHYGK